MRGFFSSSVVQRDAPESLVPKCGSCGLFRKCRSPKMEVGGMGAKRVLIVGEAPEKEDDAWNQQFSGPAGMYLQRVLQGMGVDLFRDCWTTTALICLPANLWMTPDDKQVSYCRPNLLNAIATYQPRVVVTLGRAALLSVLHRHWKDVGPLERWRGWKIPLEKHWVCPTFHPSFLMRMQNPLMDKVFFQELERAFDIAKDPPKQPDFNERIEILYEDGAVKKALAEMDDAGGWLAVDYEGNCLKPEYPEAEIVSCAVANQDRVISYLWTPAAAEATGRLLKSPRTRKIASNLKFEERWTQKTFGHGVTNWGWDTMLAAHCLDNRQGITSLKFQAFVNLGVPSYNEHIEPFLRSKGDTLYNRVKEIAVRDLLFYGGMDALLEYRLAMFQQREMGKQSED